MTSFGFDDLDRFCIPGYDRAPAFASFLPGIAGPLGIPMWAFYVNRGQAIAAFGVGSKDAAIMEFQPANKAYQAVPLTGFRTFIKLLGPTPHLYEPFSAVEAPAGGPPPERRMLVGASEVELEEISSDLGLQVNVVYFTLPGEPFAGLVRQVTVRNVGPQRIEFELLDGMPAVVPFGVQDAHLKMIGRTAEAWMAVYHLESGIPFYRVQATIGDEAEVAAIEAGHFYLPIVQNGDATGMAPRPGVIVDPSVIFANNTSLTYPERFAAHSVPELLATPQVTVCRTPCAFTAARASLASGESFVCCAIAGHISDHADIERERERLARLTYIATKRVEAQNLTGQLTDPIATSTADPRFDAYCRQTLLDNTLRGGWPVPLDGKVYHLYGRRHGDLERDYNAFLVPPEFYSQGNAAYRDVNQNRRSDVLLAPMVGDSEVLDMLGLIQPDGYNPLVVLGRRYVVPAGREADILRLVDRPDALQPLLSRPFTPGQLLAAVRDLDLSLAVAPEAFVEAVVAASDEQFAASHGEGYWIDHWYYNLDLIQAYLAVYPDRKDTLLFERKVTYHDSPWFVQPRSRKYVLTPNGARQYGALVPDEEHAALIASRTELPDLVRGEHGHGPVFRSTVFEKVFGIALLKFATLDPAGMGIEMEAGKPGWCDALNGLPGLFGSSMPAAYELLRLLDFLAAAAAEGQSHTVELPVEIMRLLHEAADALEAYDASEESDREFRCWDQLASAREAYREAVRLGFAGTTERAGLAALLPVLQAMSAKVADGIARAEALDAVPPAYFSYQASDVELLASADAHGRPYVRAGRFEQTVLPAFLEGPVHALRIEHDPARARDLYRRVRESALYDCKLRMYKTNAPLNACSHEIGRLRAFTPGWLENESVFLHMAYKYLLEVLRAGLCEEFFEEMRCGLVPFLDPAVYGRSTLENSSFIASSAHPDETLHGRGFVARLTGACAEFLSIWTYMMAGPQPFYIEDGELRLRFTPTLPRWLFREDGCLDFTFLGRCSVTYRLGNRTEGVLEVDTVTLHLPGGRTVLVHGNTVPAPYAEMVRSGEITRIEIDLA